MGSRKAMTILQSKLNLEIFITAPNGCSDASELLNNLKFVNLKDKKIIILEYGPNCTNFNNAFIPTDKVEHRHFNFISEFDMRRFSFESSTAEWLIYLEDHVLLDGDFIAELDSYLNQKYPADAVTFYSKNGTSKSIGSRAIYNWVWGESEISLFPKKPSPVCSAFLVRREAAISEIKKTIHHLKKGELEMKLIPELVRRENVSESKRLTIIHYEDINIFLAIMAVASNARITGHLEKAFLPREGWIKHMFRRYFIRSFKIRSLGKYNLIDSLCLDLMAISSITGVFLGRFFGIENAEYKLVEAHPEIKL